MRKLFATLVAAGMIAAAIPALAHHASQAEFDKNSPKTVTGVLTRVQWTNPHVRWYLDIKNEKTGEVEPWTGLHERCTKRTCDGGRQGPGERRDPIATKGVDAVWGDLRRRYQGPETGLGGETVRMGRSPITFRPSGRASSVENGRLRKSSTCSPLRAW